MVEQRPLFLLTGWEKMEGLAQPRRDDWRREVRGVFRQNREADEIEDDGADDGSAEYVEQDVFEWLRLVVFSEVRHVDFPALQLINEAATVVVPGRSTTSLTNVWRECTSVQKLMSTCD
jgi:hypothetical protein